MTPRARGPTEALFPVLAVVLWAGNAVAAKASAVLIDSVTITFYRWMAAALLIAPFVARPLVQQRHLVVANLWRLVVLGLLGSAAFPLLMYVAARDTTAINIGIIQSLMPVLALGLARMVAHAPISRSALAGIALSFIGVAIVVSNGDPALLLRHAPNRGDLLMFAATAVFAAYSVLVERWRTGLPHGVELFVQASAGTFALLPMFLWIGPSLPSERAWPLVGYAAVFASLAAPLLWIRGIELLGPARASNFFNLLPLATAVLAVLLLSEPISAALAAGGVLVVAGVGLAERSARA